MGPRCVRAPRPSRGRATPDRWGGRRQLRYFDGAHEAIDALARALEHEVPASPVAHHPHRLERIGTLNRT